MQIVDVFKHFMYPFFSVQRPKEGAHYLPKRTKRVLKNLKTRALGLHWFVSVIEICAGIDELILSGLLSVTVKVVQIKRRMGQTSLGQV